MDIIWTNLLRAILIDIVIYFTIHLLIFHIDEKNIDICKRDAKNSINLKLKKLKLLIKCYQI